MMSYTRKLRDPDQEKGFLLGLDRAETMDSLGTDVNSVEVRHARDKIIITRSGGHRY